MDLQWFDQILFVVVPMTSVISYAFIAGLSILFVIFYFRLANRLDLYDIPNSRSSHSKRVYRGAGLIMLGICFVGGLIGLIDDHFMLLGGLVGGITGFIDDLKDLKANYRLLFYSMAFVIGTMGMITQLWDYVYFFPLILVIGVGAINTFNFMDGINGISILYALVFLISVWLNMLMNGIHMDRGFTILLVISLFVMGYLNLRVNALAFLGDTGSVFLGVVISLWTLSLCVQTKNLAYLNFLLVYGVDTVLTIIQRLIKGENIFKAHRSHLYQLLANEAKWPHLRVSVLYASIQLVINVLTVYLVHQNIFSDWKLLFSMLFMVTVFYIYVKRSFRIKYSTLSS